MQTIAGYHVIEQLYDSANSLVYRAYRIADKQPVILKVLKETNPSPERIAWFKREYEVTRNIHFSGVAQVYGLETDHHHWIIVMEDSGGDSLKRLSIAGRLNLVEFLELAMSITDILGQIHQQKIIHKDINPANIIFNSKTGQVKLVDFGIATVLSRETPTFRNPNEIEGTLLYMSPEQAGRMNRTMDYRTDIYSLGVTLYELLTGQVPFNSDDPLELVHSHIARQPLLPHDIRSDVPPVLSAIILKMMAKNAEDRYQSAYGIKADLEQCLAQWNEHGTIVPFTPGRNDLSDRFQIPQKLYGREEEIDLLLSSFERVSRGTSEMMLLAGYAGIGKSALVQEIYKPVTHQRGYFIAGKFDQFQRNIPYSAFIQAFRSLMRLLLTEPEANIARWKQKILDAVGKNGNVIIDVIPEVELIIGPQIAVAVPGPSELQNRLNMVFQNFIKVFTQPQHPLVIFLDDLQWADGASLKLMELLMTAPHSRYLFLIGAYRDNEVSSSHPLQLTLEAIRGARAWVHVVNLPPLDVASVTRLVSETMLCSHQKARPLAELVVAKTDGNPFFVNEFLKSLYVEELVQFNPAVGAWEWNLARIQTRDMTDNVVDLLTARVQRFHEQTRTVLKLAACIGNQFDLATLAVVYENSPRETAIALWEAVAEGLILPLSDAYKVADLDVEGLTDTLKSEYKFAHDRIQQAVYSLIPEDQRQAVHWRVGQLLLHNIPPEERSDRIFDIVNQLNRGKSLITRPETPEKSTRLQPLSPSRLDLAELNLLAGKKAMISVAYEPALVYFRTGLNLLPEESWQQHYAVTFALSKEYARCAYLNNQFDEAETMFDRILERATTSLDKAEIYNIRMILYTSLGKLAEVIDTGIKGLHLLGLTIPTVPEQDEIDREIAQVTFLLGDRTMADLANLPLMTDPTRLAIMELLVDMLIPAWWYANQKLLYLVTLKMVNLSLQYGNASSSPFGYAWYGMILGSGLGNYRTGYESGKLALDLNERFENMHLVARVNLIFSVFVQLWRFHLRYSLEFVRRGYQVGLESGDLVWAGINGYVIIYTMLIKGDDLDEIAQETHRYLDFARRTNQVIPINMLTLSQQFILSLKGLTHSPASFSDDLYDEEHHIQEIRQSEAIRPIFWYYKIKLQVLYLFEHYADALNIAQELDALIERGAAFGNVTMPEHYFYYSLTLTALYPSAPFGEQEKYWKTLERNQEMMKTWSYNCPENFRHKYLLIAAEMARLEEQPHIAQVFYEQAIASARKNEYLHIQAIGHELAARFYLSKGQDDDARSHLTEARNSYLKWGATAKVKAFDIRYPHMCVRPRSYVSEMQTPTLVDSEQATTSSRLDLSTVIKASLALSGEMVLDNLLSKLMRIVIENAGAQRGLLIMEQQGQWAIEAQGTVDEGEITIVKSVPMKQFHTRPLIPLSIVNYVARIRESVVLDDAAYVGQFIRDDYVVANQPRSVLCAPLIAQGNLTGILYLENNLTTGAFTPDRLEILNVLASQAAISIRNAVLYTTLEQSEERYRTLFESSKDAIYITTPEGQIVNINPAGLSLFGYSREEMMEMNAVGLYVYPEERIAFQHAIARHGGVKDYEVQFRRKDGQAINCLMTATARLDEQGSIASYQGIIRDITEQKRAEQERAALLDEQARKAGELHAILESMADGLLVVDVDERIVMVNQVAATLLGQDSAALFDKPLNTLAAVDDPVLATGLQHIVEQVRNELANLDYCLPEERVALGERIVRIQTAPTLGSGSSLTGAVVVIQDITQEVEADRAKSAFIATASHEMRTPITSLKGFVDIFYMSGIENLTESQLMFLETIQRQTNKLVQLINDLLEVARLERGSFRAESRWVSVEGAIHEAVTGLQFQIEQRRVNLTLELEPFLSSIWIDGMHLSRILTNLISNAVKYVREGGCICIRARELNDPSRLPSSPGDQVWRLRDNRSVVIEVEDNGVGIRASDQDKIFSRFFRSENPLSVEAGGTGLGLAITKSLVNLHNGQIGFRSVENEGTCFWVRLPAPSTEHLQNGKDEGLLDTATQTILRKSM